MGVIYGFKKIRKFHSRLSLRDLYKVLKYSTVVDVGKVDVILPDQTTMRIYWIRKTATQLKAKYSSFFGYDIESIKKLP